MPRIDSKRRTWLITASVAGGASGMGRIAAALAMPAATATGATVATPAPSAGSQTPAGNAQAAGASPDTSSGASPDTSGTPDTPASSIEIDIGVLAPGSMMTVAWRGQPVWILNRTDLMLAAVRRARPDLADPDSKNPYSMPLPTYCRNDYRSRAERRNIFVALAVCTHLSCTPVPRFQPGPQPGLPDPPNRPNQPNRPNRPNGWPGGFLCPCHGSTYDLAGRVFKNVPATQNLDIPRYMFVSPARIVIGRDEKGEA